MTAVLCRQSHERSGRSSVEATPKLTTKGRGLDFLVGRVWNSASQAKGWSSNWRWWPVQLRCPRVLEVLLPLSSRGILALAGNNIFSGVQPAESFPGCLFAGCYASQCNVYEAKCHPSG